MTDDQAIELLRRLVVAWDLNHTRAFFAALCDARQLLQRVSS